MPSTAHLPFVLGLLPNGWQVGRFGGLEAIVGLRHAVTTRRGPDVEQARDDRPNAAATCAAALGLAEAALCEQVHGTKVLHVTAGGLAGEADALVTDTPGLALCAFSADCPLILAAERSGRAVGIAHASWRGTVGGVATKLIAAMLERFGVAAGDVVAGIGPSAGPCCYEVGPGVLAAAVAGLGRRAETFFRPRAGVPGKWLLDLWAANRDQLRRAALREENVHVAGVCTICRNDLLPSFRAEGSAAGRFVAAIGLAGK